MQMVLPWIALGIAVLAIFIKDGIRSSSTVRGPGTPAGAYIILLLLVGLGMFAGWRWSTAYEGLFPAVSGFGVGAFLAAVSYSIGLMPSQTPAGRSAPIALACAAVAFVSWFPPQAAMCLVFGAAAAAWILSIGKIEEPNPWAMRSAVAAAAIVACNALSGSSHLGVDPTNTGTWLGTAIALSGVIAGIVRLLVAKEKTSVAVADGLSSFTAFVLMAGGAYLVAWKLDLFGSVPLIFLLAGAMALIINWLIPEGAPSSTVRVLLATLIWVAGATAAFGFAKGFGMAVTLVAASSMLLLSGNRRALLSLGPLGALVFYRVFREAHTDATHAFDIGQHYAMIGVLVGAVLPVMAQEWLRLTGKRGGGATLLAGALWVVLLGGVPIVIAVALAAKGIIGYLIGLGVGAVMESTRGERSAHSLSLALGLSAMMTLLYDWLAPHLDLERHDKLIALAWLGGVVLVAAIVIAFLSADFGKTETPVVAEA